ncbi:hypothetical protein [Lactococcus lactis]|uniref:hypothetical protein n=1 Tax=Lactococcus lactis TaxID=1358 RepID=UPI001914C48E|nr:hypothetical protein [Lactococcus lactis]WDA69178.1 hypothetical protein IL310_03800 [Lactococcus lactis]
MLDINRKALYTVYISQGGKCEIKEVATIAPFASKGRPKGEKPPKKNLTIRLDEDDSIFLADYSEKNNITKSETVRKGLDLLKKQDK